MSKVEKWMSTEVVVIEKDATVIEAIHLMKEKNIQRLPVMDKGKIAGIVTEKLLAEFRPSRATSLDLWEIHYILSKAVVAEAMNPSPCKVKPDTGLSDCALLLHRGRKGVAIALPAFQGERIEHETDHRFFFRGLNPWSESQRQDNQHQDILFHFG